MRSHHTYSLLFYNLFNITYVIVFCSQVRRLHTSMFRKLKIENCSASWYVMPVDIIEFAYEL